MKKFNRYFVIQAIVLAALSFALVACDDELLSVDEGDSSETSESECIIDDPWRTGGCPLSECTLKKEGQVKTIWVGNPKYGEERYYKCENGSWVEGDIRLTCDTAGVLVGSVCIRTESTNIFNAGMGYFGATKIYVYAGHGVWKDFDGLEKMTKECTAENNGEKESLVYGWGGEVTVYYMCSDGEWHNLDELDYRCRTLDTDLGDTCSFEKNGEMQYYMYSKHDLGGPARQWKEAVYDPKLGYCASGAQRYVDSDGVYYYCDGRQWLQANIVPRQYTDPRKEGLTDEEFDMLDLPKDAEVGDRIGGLLENCWHGVEIYDYCMPQNYYRYREGGSWTVETEEERNNDPQFRHKQCTTGRHGVVTTIPPTSNEPGRVYKCTYGVDVLVDQIFGRTENGYDPKLGYCTVDTQRYVESDGVYFSCENGQWSQAKLVPRQYTDSRKEGLTDEEFDMLDLPKDAEVGDRVGGLLEDCWQNKKLLLGSSKEWAYMAYDYCLPHNYYRYREDGSWTVETAEDTKKDPQFRYEQCTAERNGVMSTIPPSSNNPERVYKCTDEGNVLIDYVFERTE